MKTEPEISPETRSMLQATAIVEMLTGLGAEASEERVAYYLRLLGQFPPFLLREACDAAVLEDTTGFPPSPGAIAQHARRITGRRRSEERARVESERRIAERAALLARISEDSPALLEEGSDRAKAVERIVDATAKTLAMPKERAPRRPAYRVVGGEIVEVPRRVKDASDGDR